MRALCASVSRKSKEKVASCESNATDELAHVRQRPRARPAYTIKASEIKSPKQYCNGRSKNYLDLHVGFIQVVGWPVLSVVPVGGSGARSPNASQSEVAHRKCCPFKG
ncbi:hypothetical protein EVAR_87687_1 [Eumeta japonica]|uniref:Uncharacterized protein n=1 Tax=Eumeta variegata TaxID=151549 RepID=A0A4C1XKT0_EUMVA|nr:hypothetical protein EVAR_87687_1 [Eumeta japonica]